MTRRRHDRLATRNATVSAARIQEVRAALAVRAKTIDEENLSVEAVLATERRATIRDPKSDPDPRRRRIIDEILLADGGQWPEQVVLLDDHASRGVANVIGSVRDVRREGRDWVGRLYFSHSDPLGLTTWSKVREGHLRDVSIGYEQVEYVDIPRRQARTIAGRTFTAGDRVLRITTRWSVKEVSVTPFAADRATQVRHAITPDPDNVESTTMDTALRHYLESIGLSAESTDDEAVEFHERLTGAQRARADGIAAGTIRPAGFQSPDPGQDPTQPSDPGQDRTQRSDPGQDRTQRSDPQPRADNLESVTARIQIPDPVDAAAERRAERARIEEIRQLGTRHRIPDDLVTRAIAEEWPVETASRHFLDALRGDRSDPVDNRAPAGHVRDHQTDCTRQALAMSLCIRSGLDPARDLSPVADDLVDGYGDARREQLEQLAHRSDPYRDMSLIDICREAVRLDGGRIPHGRNQAIRSAVSGASLSYIFTTSINARLQQSFQEAPDSTVGWVVENPNLPNFQTQERPRLGPANSLDKLGRGDTAKHGTFADTRETYRPHRYARQFVIDEQDLIDDNLDALTKVPAMLGAAARRIRPDLVYAILLANAALADGTTLFHSDHANTGTAVLGAAGLKAGIVAMAKQTESGVNLNITPRYLIVPQDLVFTARELVTSANIIITGSTDSERGARNVLMDEDLAIAADNRIGAAGVTDPATGQAYTGAATKWFLSAAPLQHPTIEVGYVRGNTSPVVRSFTLDRGQWGVGFDVHLDIGAKALDHRGLYYSAGTG